MARRTWALIVMWGLFYSVEGLAEQKVFQYDDWQGSIEQNADGKGKHPSKVYPGFVQGEAFGQIYRPKPNEYPIKITSIKLVVASPANITPPGNTTVDIEIWNDSSQTVVPNISAPTFKISTTEFWNSAKGKTNMPLTGNSAMVYKFDYADPKGHPPEIKQGNIRVVIRFKMPAEDLSTYWNEVACIKQVISGITLGCGCSKVAPITDSTTTAKSNFVHIITPIGQCSGSKKWMWIEDVQKEGKSMSGDFILRMDTQTSASSSPQVDAGSAPDVAQPDAGSSADVGSSDAGGGSVDAGKPPLLNPEVNLVTPKTILEGEISAIEIIGKYFEPGVKVKVGKYVVQVVSVSDKKIQANVMPGPAPGHYAVIVENPSGGIGFKDNALEVLAKVAPDAGPVDVGEEDAGEADAGEPDAGAADAGAADIGADDASSLLPSKPEIEIITPDSGPADKETEVTIVGKRFKQGAVVKIGSVKLLVLSTKPTSIVAKVLPPMVPGIYTVLVENPDGEVGFKEKSFTVTATAVLDAGSQDAGVATPAPSSPVDEGCVASPTGSGPLNAAVMLLVFGALALILARRRRA